LASSYIAQSGDWRTSLLIQMSDLPGKHFHFVLQFVGTDRQGRVHRKFTTADKAAVYALPG